MKDISSIYQRLVFVPTVLMDYTTGSTIATTKKIESLETENLDGKIIASKLLVNQNAANASLQS